MALPRRWASVPLIGGAGYVTIGQAVEIGPFTFTVLRILIAAGVARAIFRHEKLAGGMNGLDRLMLFWAFWAVLSSAFHDAASSALVFHLGFVYNTCGVYFLSRIFCSSLEETVLLCRAIGIMLALVAIELVYEHVAFHNLFSILGGVPNTPMVREGRIRAFGPFVHPILAGSVGAVSLPLMVGIWRHHRKAAVLGIIAC